MVNKFEVWKVTIIIQYNIGGSTNYFVARFNESIKYWGTWDTQQTIEDQSTNTQGCGSGGFVGNIKYQYLIKFLY